MSALLKKKYNDEIVKKLKKEFNYSSIMEVPKITKITINMGLGDAVEDKKIINFALDDMTKIAGQKPVTTLSKKIHCWF